MSNIIFQTAAIGFLSEGAQVASYPVPRDDSVTQLLIPFPGTPDRHVGADNRSLVISPPFCDTGM